MVVRLFLSVVLIAAYVISSTESRYVPLSCISHITIHGYGSKCQANGNKVRCKNADIELSVGCTSVKAAKDQQSKEMFVEYPTAVEVEP